MVRAGIRAFSVLLLICTKRYSQYSLYIDFLNVLCFSFPVVTPNALPPKTFKISCSRFALEKNFELDL